MASGPEEPLARRGEGGGEGEHAMSTPTSILPPAYRQAGINGEDKTWQFSCFVGGHAAMTNYVENKFLISPSFMLILSFPCLRAEALQRAGVQTGIQAKDYKDMDSCFCRNDKESEVTLRTPNSEL